MKLHTFIKSALSMLLSAGVAYAGYGARTDIISNVGHEWGVIESGNLPVKSTTLVTARNSSYIPLHISYYYDGNPVTQNIPSGATIPLGIYGKIDFNRNYPKVYRVSELGTKIVGKSYAREHIINPSDLGQQFGGTCGTVLELSIGLSAFRNTDVDVRLLMHMPYNLNKSAVGKIFPNLSRSYLSYIGLGQSLAASAQDPLQARAMLNLPTDFAQMRTQNAASNMADTATSAHLDAIDSKGWVANTDARYVGDAIAKAGRTVQEFLATQGDSANLIEW